MWSDITLNKWVLDIVTHHYPFTVPVQGLFSYKSLFQKEVSSLFHLRAIKEVPQECRERDFCSWYFLILWKKGGLLPILDQRRLNRYICHFRFRMTALASICSGSRLVYSSLFARCTFSYSSPHSPWEISTVSGGIWSLSVQDIAVQILHGTEGLHEIPPRSTSAPQKTQQSHLSLLRWLAYQTQVTMEMSLS